MTRYQVIRRGTHQLPISKANHDIPSPGEVVAECSNIDGLGGPPWMSEAEARQDARHQLATAIKDARKQGWRFSKVE